MTTDTEKVATLLTLAQDIVEAVRASGLLKKKPGRKRGPRTNGPVEEEAPVKMKKKPGPKPKKKTVAPVVERDEIDDEVDVEEEE